MLTEIVEVVKRVDGKMKDEQDELIYRFIVRCRYWKFLGLRGVGERTLNMVHRMTFGGVFLLAPGSDRMSLFPPCTCHLPFVST